MTEVKEQMKNHVSAAKEWLGKAEQSLDEDNDIKGNLNLMLAQAELKRAQETKQANKKGYTSLLIHSILVTSVAGLVLVVGFGGINVFNTKPVVNSVASLNTAPKVKNVKLESVEDIKAAPERKIESRNEVLPVGDKTVSAEQVDINKKDTLVVKENTADTNSLPKKEEVSVTPMQMQQLVRAAGKSLRGQD